MQLSPGARVRSFEVVGPLGAGGMGAVYRAHDSKLGRDVAIKILQDKLGGSPEYLLRFQREARAASALNHPNIVTIFEIDEFEGVPFIAMELVEGKSLREFLKTGPMPVKKLIDVAAQIADGLSAAHDRGIIHRDLKPENVMITGQGRVKIVDFGLARINTPATSGESTSDLPGMRTPAGRVLGTASYVSPEQAAGRSIDFRSDQFSLGSVLYELATGRRAFEKETTIETLSAILRDEPVPVQRLNPKAPPPLCWIIERLLAKDANERYSSTSDLARELRTLRDHLPETARTDQYPTRLTARRKVVTGAIVAALIVTVAVALDSARRFNKPVAPLPNQKYLAVLPFKDLSGRADGQLFSQGFSEAVSARLSKYSGVQVIPPASSAPLIAKGADFRRISQELGATLLLNASVQRAGEKLRVSYSLLDAAKGTQIAGDALNGTLQNIWSVQDEVADAIATDLGIEQKHPLSQHVGLETAEEQDLYVRALGGLERPQDDKSLDSAITLLRELTETASNSALVHAALGRAYLAKYTSTHDKQYSDRAIRACERARSLDAGSADVLLTVGKVRQLTGQHVEAADAFRHALAVQPNLAEAAVGLGEALHGSGQIVAAQQAFKRSIELRPTWWLGHHSLGILYLSEARFDEAAAQFREVVRLNPDNAWGYMNLGFVAVTKGQLQDGVNLFQRAISLGGGAGAYTNLAYCYYFLGQYDQASINNVKATELGPTVGTFWANLGDSCTWSSTCRDQAAPAYRKAIGLLRGDLEVNPKNARSHATLAVCLAKTGNIDEATQHMSRAVELDPHNPTRMYQAARIAYARKRPDEAVAWLKRALSAGYQAFEVQRDPEFRDLHATESFRALLKKVGQPA